MKKHPIYTRSRDERLEEYDFTFTLNSGANLKDCLKKVQMIFAKFLYPGCASSDWRFKEEERGMILRGEFITLRSKQHSLQSKLQGDECGKFVTYRRKGE